MSGDAEARAFLKRGALPWVLVLLAAAGALAPRVEASDLRLRVVEVQSEATTAYVDPETGMYVIAPPTGHVEAEYGQRQLQARRAEYDPEAEILRLAGDVLFREPGLEARADRVEAELGREAYRLEGQVRIERDREDGPPNVLLAARVLYRPAEGEAIAEGGVRAEEGDRWFQAAGARLWEGLSRLELTGDVAGEWGDWSVERATRVQVELGSGHVTLLGPAELVFQVRDPQPEEGSATSP